MRCENGLILIGLHMTSLASFENKDLPVLSV